MSTEVYMKMTAEEERLMADAAEAVIDKIGERCAGVVIHVFWRTPRKDEFGRDFSVSTAMGLPPSRGDTHQLARNLAHMLRDVPDHAREWAERMKKQFGLK